MSFYIRVFSSEEDYPSRFAINEELSEAGFEFSTFPGKYDTDFDEKDWKYFTLEYSEGYEPLRLERNIKGKDAIFEEEQQEFLEILRELPRSKGRDKAINAVETMIQLYAIDIDDDINDEGREFLNCLVEFLSDATEGYVQIDGEGIYAVDGRMIIEME